MKTNIRVKACQSNDFRLRHAETLSNKIKQVGLEHGEEFSKKEIHEGVNKMAGMGDTSFSFPASSADEYVVKDMHEGKISELFSGAAAYHVVQRGCDVPFPLRLEMLLPPAATVLPPGGDSGGDFCPTPQGDVFAEKTIGRESNLYEKAQEEMEKEKEKEKAQEKREVDVWETYMHRRKAKEGVENTDGKEKENEKEKGKEKEQLNFAGQHDDELWEAVILEDYMAKGRTARRRVRVGRLEGLEATRARAGELDRAVGSLLFPGLLKRKFSSFIHDTSIYTVVRANAGRLKVEKKKEEKMKEKKGMVEEEMVKEKDMGRTLELFSFGNFEQKEKVGVRKEEKERETGKEVKRNSELFVFGNCVEVAKPKLFVFGDDVKPLEPVSYYGKVEEGSEVCFVGKSVLQVGEDSVSPEPGKIRFMHRLQGQLKVATVWGGQSLEDWARQLLGERIGRGGGGMLYFLSFLALFAKCTRKN